MRQPWTVCLGWLLGEQPPAISTTRSRTAASSFTKLVARKSASTVARRAASTASSIPPLSTKVPACSLAASRARKRSRAYMVSSSWVNRPCLRARF